MPRATDGVVDHEAIDQRPAIVRTVGADGKHLGPVAHQQYLFLAAISNKPAAVGGDRRAQCLQRDRARSGFRTFCFSRDWRSRPACPLETENHTLPIGCRSATSVPGKTIGYRMIASEGERFGPYGSPISNAHHVVAEQLLIACGCKFTQTLSGRAALAKHGAMPVFNYARIQSPANLGELYPADVGSHRAVTALKEFFQRQPTIRALPVSTSSISSRRSAYSVRMIVSSRGSEANRKTSPRYRSLQWRPAPWARR